MGKHNNRRRKELFAKLEADGRLTKPLYAKKGKKVETKPKPKVEKKQNHPCCLIKYENALPMGFRTCYGCPLDNGEPMV